MSWIGQYKRSTDSLKLHIEVLDTSGLLTQADGAVTLTSWKDAGEDTTATADPLISLTVDGATNASPIVMSVTAAHNLQTGMRVTVASVGGNTAANGTFTITRVSATTFSLDGSTGNGAYTSGGTVRRSGLYYKEIACTSLDATARTITMNCAVSGTNRQQAFRFQMY